MVHVAERSLTVYIVERHVGGGFLRDWTLVPIGTTEIGTLTPESMKDSRSHWCVVHTYGFGVWGVSVWV